MRKKQPSLSPQQLKALHSPNWTARRGALIAIAHSKAPDRVSLLCQHLLHDPHQHCRSAAAEAIAEYNDASAIAPLLTALGHERGYTQQLVIRALGRAGAALKAQPSTTPADAIEYTPTTSETLPAQQATRTAIADALLALLSTRSTPLASKREALSALALLGEQRAAPAIAKLLLSPYKATPKTELQHQALHSAAIEALGQLGGPTATQALRQYLRKRKPQRLGAAINALATLNDGEAFAQILSVAPRAPREAARALAKLGPPQLLHAFERATPPHSTVLASALAHSKNPDAIPPLLHHYRHPTPPRAGIDERLALLDALLALGFDPVEPLDQDHRACLQAKGIAAPKVSAEHGLDVLLALSHSNVKEQRVRAIAGLRHLLSAPPDSQPLAKWDAQTQEARARLHALLDDPEPWVQYHTILALQQLGSSESIPALLQRLDQFKPTSPSDSRLGKALELLGSLVQRTPTQLELVLTGTSKVLADEETNEPTLLSACKALQSVGAPAVIAPLMALLERPSSKLRRAAAQALEGLSYPPRDGVERLRIALALERVGECWGTVAETDWLAVFSPSFAPGPSLGRNTLAEKERMAMGLSLLEHGSEAAVEALLDWLFEPPLVLHTPEPRTQWAKRAERLFGAYASLLVGAALGLDQFYSRQGACEEYSYGHGPALQAIELLRHDPSPMATRLLQCVLRKQPIELLTMHYEEYHTQFEAIDFVEEHNAARRALGERGLGD